MSPIPRLGRRAALALAVAPLARPALAQGRFPDRPIRMYVPYGAGGTTDIQMRALCEGASRRLGQPVVVENRTGAGGILGAQALLQARPDGYTLSQMPVSVFRYPQMVARPPFDPMRDFTYVLQVTGYLFGVVVKADAPWRNFGEFLAHAKANPGRVSYGTPGAGTSLHITMEQIGAEQGIEFVHVPFRGVAENMQALLSGQINATADSSGWAELVRGGQMRLLCTWGPQRAKAFPDVPTLREGGIDIVSDSPFGLGGPANMEPAVVAALQDAFREAIQDPTHLGVLDRFDMAPAYLDTATYTAAVRDQYRRDGEMIRRLGLRAS